MRCTWAAWAAVLGLLLQTKLVAARTKTFQLSITWGPGSPDGVTREMFFINGQSPGPVLYINEGDQVEIEVDNNAPVPIAIHSHGIEQYNSSWSDGVPGVTQRLIKPGATFVYKWTATQFGDYWYHGHSRGHIADGLYGQIRIKPFWLQPTPFQILTNDTKELDAIQEAVNSPQMVAVSDWIHLTSEEIFSISVTANIDPGCFDTILINGKGAVNCQTPEFLASMANPLIRPLLVGKTLSDKGCLPVDIELLEGSGKKYYDLVKPDFYNGCKETKGQQEVLHVDAGDRWASFNVVGAATGDQITISLDGHSMIVYAVDGQYVIPQTVEAVTLIHGSRYGILLSLTAATPSDYTLRACSSGANQVICGYAKVSYNNGGPLPTSSPAEAYITYGASNASEKVRFLNNAILPAFPPQKPPSQVDALHVLRLGRTADGASWRWRIGSDANSSIPYGTSLEDADPILMHQSSFVEKNLAISTTNGSWVDLVLVTEPVQPGHPIHKHSNKMFLIGQGQGEWKWKTVEEAAKANPQFFNLEAPAKVDSIYTTPALAESSWTVVRYQSVNPGPFILHCHFTSHIMGGMQIVLLDGVDKWPTVPQYYLDQEAK